MTRAVILVERGFQDEEFVFPYYRMLEEGWEVDVASPEGKTVNGKYGVPARCNANVIMLEPKAYAAVVIPGGFECPDRLRMNDDVIRFVRQAHEAGAVLAAICHGPWVLVSADLVRGVMVTGYPSIAVDLANAGANYVDVPVVSTFPRNIVTAQHYRNNGAFMRKVIERVNSQEKQGAWDERHTSVF